METENNKVSIWNILNKWLYDGSYTSEFPKQLIDDKIIGPQYLLYYFKDSVYNLWINEHFNNYGIFQLNKVEILKFIKECILECGYRPKIMPKIRSDKSKIFKILKKRYPYFKNDDVDLLVEKIDCSAEKDRIYETLGLYKGKKEKTKKDKKPTKEKEITINLEKTNSIKENKIEPTNDSLEDFLSGFSN